PGRPWRVEVADAGTRFELVYFHPREEWIRANLPVGAHRLVSGRLEEFDGRLQIVHPDYVLAPEQLDEIPAFEPVYPLTQGLSNRVMRRAVAAALERLPELPEWIEPGRLAREGWPGWAEALRRAHAPQGPADLSPRAPERMRLAYDELFSHQLTLAIARARRHRLPGIPTVGDGRLRERVLAALPFELTGAQRRAVGEILLDMSAPRRMHRLLQGDVGSGKTLVAFLAMVTAVEAGGQAAMMAPTEVLARQHFRSLAPLAEAAGVRVELLTGRDRGPERRGKLEAIASGEADIVVGTHALFQKDVAFHDLRLVVIDEQHRFGVRQRLDLGAKGRATDVLVMTATPIPRSLALASCGDMDLSVLDEKPPGRKPVRTALVSARRLEEVIAHLERALDEGRQAYWVCPLVEESEALDVAAAVERHRMLAARLGPERVGLVHGQMPPAERDRAMADFAAGRTRLLVATTVIEVGVDVPNASIMVIEGAERFGLAQLHQLRGRVGRGSAEASCVLLYDPPLSEAARRRLEVIRDTEDGFRIAEEDLKLRGAGDLLGTQQSGLPRFRVADLEVHGDLVKAAQDDARLLLHVDPELASERGQAARLLLWLMERDRSLRLLAAG
ncbi:MAG: ATP-dependent DNA helicase RecG, partial [Alphaproteobacteria bacterium]